MRNQGKFFRSTFPELFERLHTLKQLQVTACSGPRMIPTNEQLTLAKSNTIILAICCKDCVILAGDRRILAGLEIVSDSTQKLHQVSGFSGVGLAGRCTSAQETVEDLHHIFGIFESNYDKELSLDGQVRILEDLVKYFYWRSLVLNDEQFIAAVLAGYDKEYKRSRIFQVWVDGLVTEEAKFIGVGCGYPDVKTTLKKRWRKDMDRITGLKFIIEVLGDSGEASGGVSDYRISPPTVAVIDKAGFNWVSEKRIQKIVQSLVKKTEAHHAK